MFHSQCSPDCIIQPFGHVPYQLNLPNGCVRENIGPGTLAITDSKPMNTLRHANSLSTSVDLWGGRKSRGLRQHPALARLAAISPEVLSLNPVTKDLYAMAAKDITTAVAAPGNHLLNAL